MHGFNDPLSLESSSVAQEPSFLFSAEINDYFEIHLFCLLDVMIKKVESDGSWYGKECHFHNYSVCCSCHAMSEACIGPDCRDISHLDLELDGIREDVFSLTNGCS